MFRRAASENRSRKSDFGNMEESVTEFPSLSNQLLVSMPQMFDSNFHRTVILMCQHNKQGAMGIVVNRLADQQLSDIFNQLSLPIASLAHINSPVYLGGPVHQEVGIVVHNGNDASWESSLCIGDQLCLTTSKDILSSMAQGQGPERAILSLGYAGWGPGQLENEIKNNFWFSTPADMDIIFCKEVEHKWNQAASLLGIDTTKLSTHVGHA